MQPLLDAATAAFLETGCALLVGTALPDGEPMAARGWGCTVLANEPDRARLRLLLSADDTRGHEHARPGDAVAVTATSVHTLHSTQLKGVVEAVGAAAADDAGRLDAYCDAFFGDIQDSDGTAPELTERMRPSGAVVWTVVVGEAFDQTPGPAAGDRVGSGPS